MYTPLRLYQLYLISIYTQRENSNLFLCNLFEQAYLFRIYQICAGTFCTLLLIAFAYAYVHTQTYTVYVMRIRIHTRSLAKRDHNHLPHTRASIIKMPWGCFVWPSHYHTLLLSSSPSLSLLLSLSLSLCLLLSLPLCLSAEQPQLVSRPFLKRIDSF